MFNNFSSENWTVFETMWKNSVQLDRPQITLAQKDAMWMPVNHGNNKNTHTFILNTAYFSITKVTRTRRTITSYVSCLSCSPFRSLVYSASYRRRSCGLLSGSGPSMALTTSLYFLQRLEMFRSVTLILPAFRVVVFHYAQEKFDLYVSALLGITCSFSVQENVK